MSDYLACIWMFIETDRAYARLLQRSTVRPDVNGGFSKSLYQPTEPAI